MSQNANDFDRVKKWIAWRFWMMVEFDGLKQKDIVAGTGMSPGLISTMITRSGDDGVGGQKFVDALDFLNISIDGAVWESRRWSQTDAGKAWLDKRCARIAGPPILVEKSDELREALQSCHKRGVEPTPAMMSALLDDQRLRPIRTMQEWVSNILFYYEKGEGFAQRLAESRAVREAMRSREGVSASRAKTIGKRDAKE